MRPYQVVVWGATGFTGRLVCEHILQNYQGQVRWAMAGRSKQKLESIQAELAHQFPAAKDVPLLVANTADQASIDDFVSKADVVVSTVGPFYQHGTPLVDAAVRVKTHLCDITGETWWVKDMAEKYHYQAVEAGVKLVSCCGYDSTPFDFGVLFVVDHLRQKYGRKTASVEAYIAESLGGVSGGTIASGMQLSMLSPDVALEVQQPYYLNNPPDERAGPDQPDSVWPMYSHSMKRWSTLSIMSICNSRVVRRSWALLGRKYGENFSYTERMLVPNAVFAVLVSLALGAAQVVLSSRLLQPLVKMLVPKQGEGPSRKSMIDGRYKFKFVGRSEDVPNQKPVVVTAEVKGVGDPGYWVTARWVLECALCLALQGKELEAAGCKSGGLLTPASAFGQVGIQRFRAAGTEFNITHVQE